MRVVVAGLGVQGNKRQRVADGDCVCTVDPVNPEADYAHIEDVPTNSFDAVLACIPDAPKMDFLNYCVDIGKSVLVEKPLWADSAEEILALQEKALSKGVVVYTAYNHRFEPHFMRMRSLIRSGALGKIYSCRMFYGNGTARLVRNSVWRDRGAGVLPDLGSHLLDTCRFWFDDCGEEFHLISAHSFENKSPDHVVIYADGEVRLELEMTMLMWKNHFTCDILAENGSAHIESLCKWDATVFTHRRRVLPSGRPAEERVVLVEPDPTWEAEYQHFTHLVESKAKTDFSSDLWIHRTLAKLNDQAIQCAGGGSE